MKTIDLTAICDKYPLGEGSAEIDCRSAIVRAIVALDAINGGQHDNVLRLLVAIYRQRGCEDLDPSVDDGTLTSLMDVIIFG